MNMHAAVEVLLHALFILALVGDEWIASLPDRFILGERAPGTFCIRELVSPTISPDVAKRKIC
jgi:hypothetical protein